MILTLKLFVEVFLDNYIRISSTQRLGNNFDTVSSGKESGKNVD